MFTTSPKNVWSPSKAVREPFFAGIQVSYLFFLSFEIPVLFFGWVGKTVSMKLYHYYRYAIIIIIIITVIISIIMIVNINIIIISFQHYHHCY